MNITNKINHPIWRTVQSKVRLTKELQSLDEIAHNLWWTWNKDALDLFSELDRELWNTCRHNPVLLLQNLSSTRLNEILKDTRLKANIKNVSEQFNNYISRELNKNVPSVAYFSMEYGLANILKIYSGGLGILAGDYLKEASDSCSDITGIGLLYRYGYFTQSISPDGHQVAEYEFQNFEELPIKQVFYDNGRPMVLAVPYPERDVYAYIWQVNIGRVKLYLLDTDNDMNNEFDRPITHQLYGGDWENRIKQEYLLGIGGVLLLDKLKIKKQIYHCNEGHAAFLNIQRLVECIANKGLNFWQALEVVRASGLYTVHTPVAAGHDYFDEGLLYKYFGNYTWRLGISWQELIDLGREHPGSNEKFSMSVFALNTCMQANGVSLLHGKVSRAMFQPIWPGYFTEELHVGHVTNGVHMPTWSARQMKEIYEETFGKDYYEESAKSDIWYKIQNIPDEKLWEARIQLKKRLLTYIGEQIKDGNIKSQMPPSQIFSIIERFNPNALLVGFARRFATYKRAHLLFSDTKRLERLLNNEERPIHFIFAGKAHPNDGAGQDLIKKIVDISMQPEFAGKIIFLENYDMQLAKRLISGVDIWLNTPTRLLEASGTSGEKALMNGVLNFSVLDGWWYEGYREDAGWCLPAEETYSDVSYQNEIDAKTIYYVFEHLILPPYYSKNNKGYSPQWIQYIKNSIKHIAPQYTTKRMINDYIEKFYEPLSVRSKTIIKNDYQKAKELASWKEDTLMKWDKIVVDSIKITNIKGETIPDTPLLLEGNMAIVEIVIDKKDMNGDLGIDLVLTQYDIKKEKHNYISTQEIPMINNKGSKLYFTFQFEMAQSGLYNYLYRLYPKHPNMSHRMDFPLVRWI